MTVNSLSQLVKPSTLTQPKPLYLVLSTLPCPYAGHPTAQPSNFLTFYFWQCFTFPIPPSQTDGVARIKPWGLGTKPAGAVFLSSPSFLYNIFKLK